MKEIVLGSIIASLNIKENDDLLVYSGSHAFRGKFKKMMTANLGFNLEVNIKTDGTDKVVDLMVPCEQIVAMGKIRNESIQTVSDSKINADAKRSKRRYESTERNIEKAGSAKPVAEGGVQQ